MKTNRAVKSAQDAVSLLCGVLLCALFFACPVRADHFVVRNASGFSGVGAEQNSRENALAPSVGSASSEQTQEKSEQTQEKEENDPFRRDRNGIQTYFPAIAKIVGRSDTKTNEAGDQTTPFYYGTGAYVAEYNAWGIVITNWHVVSEATESIDVYFPSGVYSARVILRDDIWDLAALIIARPADISPLPISNETPRLGDTFWVGGYGQSNGLADFEMNHGKLTSYVSLINPDEEPGVDSSGVAEGQPGENREEDIAKMKPSPLCETASIQQGVRQGDSGGPILNRYGELAGILWGSDGQCTMGTTCVRMQSFLTQALRRASEIYANKLLDYEETGVSPISILPWPDLPADCAVAAHSDLDMYEALRTEGTFPISKKTLYVPADKENPEDFMRFGRNIATSKVERSSLEYLRKNEYAVPPSPPIFSPTFVVMQRDLKSVHPEVADEDAFKALDAYALAQAKKAREEEEFLNSQALWANESRRGIANTAGVTDDPGIELGLEGETLAQGEPSERSGAAQQPGVESADSGSEDEKAAGAEEGGAALPETELEEQATDKAFLEGGAQLSNLTTYVVVILVFCVFFFAIHLQNGARDSYEREKRRKTRLQDER